MPFWIEDCLYKHDNNTDVAFHVVHQQLMDGGDWQLVVYWWNVGECHKPWCMDIRQNITVKKADVGRWKPVSTELM